MRDLEFSAEAELDFELIFDHLASAYAELGDEPDAALRQAADRTREIGASVNVLAKSPSTGTLRPDIRAGIRFEPLKKTVIWFLPDEERACFAVIALFFGGQDPSGACWRAYSQANRNRTWSRRPRQQKHCAPHSADGKGAAVLPGAKGDSAFHAV
ncbi:type II toxin-antitoxin system RelE/ParE family toxin [Paracoccus marinaquae]|uniref:Type II toxin-antitoxin system RelE/ParE family toxin n=1 Tax=Paracoccus marinaquae TaxID=2841926 RepID=A0ABS6APH5_9RHOB|nr:type II toxin-antitoxin system RelE/ParE family toxin [Paracoccus marinaquae]MBU3031747.1 type II toxin-antitoxin system RelE/ParE family toxin [Paracoccus marinaquae]